jgi:geranylgeranyl pyrophosphate synthase
MLDRAHTPPLIGTDADAMVAQIEATMRRLVALRPGGVLAHMAQDHLATGGKRLRARLAAAATCALGGRPTAAVAWGAACELAHNATLVHDDLQDGDTHRRGQPTTWKRYGMAQAVNVGDMLLMLPFAAVGEAQVGGECQWRLCEALAAGMADVIDGQASECDMTARARVDAEAYTAMVRGKTGALFALPVRGAALAAGLTVAQAEACARPFATLGALFQMQDDLLDLYGNKGRNERGADLKEGKISALVVQHIRLHPEDTAWLTALLRTPREQTAQEAVDDAIARFVAGGAQQAVLDAMLQAARQAQAEVPAALAPLLHQLIERVQEPIAHLL